jgi:hypothetical protein
MIFYTIIKFSVNVAYLTDDALRSQKDHVALTWLLCEKKTGLVAAYMSMINDVYDK